jgi:hypothetical protein
MQHHSLENNNFGYNSSFNPPIYTSNFGTNTVDHKAVDNLFQFVQPKQLTHYHPAIPKVQRPEWYPTFEDKNLIDEWFDALHLADNPLLSNMKLQTEIQVGGREVALFLKKSNLPNDTLRSIWSLVDEANSGKVNS